MAVDSGSDIGPHRWCSLAFTFAAARSKTMTPYLLSADLPFIFENEAFEQQPQPFLTLADASSWSWNGGCENINSSRI